MHNVFITGATGFIGTHLIKQLLSQKHSVRALIRPTSPSHPFSNKVDIVKGDLLDAKSLVNSCKDIDTLFHLGGYAHATENNKAFAQQHYLINYQGTKNILTEAINAQVKNFIFFSTVKAVRESERIIDESRDKSPLSPYGIAKREAEKLVLEAKNKGMHVCVLRPALVYGPGWKGNLASMLRTIDRGFFPPLPESNNCRSMISVEDVCQAALLAAHHPAANGKIYFLTDGVSYSTKQIFLLMREALGKSPPSWSVPLWIFKLLALSGDIGAKIIRRRLPFNSDTLSKLFGSAHYNSQRIQHELGFKPLYDLKKMLPIIIEQYRSS